MGSDNYNLSSLISLLPKNGYTPKGAIGGIQAGIQLADYLDSMDRSRRLDDINYETSLLEPEAKRIANEQALANLSTTNAKLQEFEEASPSRRAKNLLDQTTTEFKQKQYDSGRMSTIADLEFENKLDELAKTKGDNAVKLVQSQGDLALKFQEETKDGMLTDQRYQMYRNQFKLLGIPLPPTLDDPKTVLMLSKIAKGALVTAEYVNKHEEAERQRNTYKDIAKIRSDSASIYKDQDDYIMNTIVRKEEILPDDIRKFSVAMEKDFKSSMEGSKVFEQANDAAASLWATNPKLRKEWENKGGKKAYIETVLRGFLVEQKAEQIINRLSGKVLKDSKGSVISNSISKKDKSSIMNLLEGKSSSATGSEKESGFSERTPVGPPPVNQPKTKEEAEQALNMDIVKLQNIYGQNYEEMRKFIMKQQPTVRQQMALRWVESKIPSNKSTAAASPTPETSKVPVGTTDVLGDIYNRINR